MAGTQPFLLLVTVALGFSVAFVKSEQVFEKPITRDQLKQKLHDEVLFSKDSHTTDSRPNEARRVVGGTPVTPGQYPWLASLRVIGQGSRFYRHLCGGSLIGERVVFTAAHCSFFPPGIVEVGLGEHDLDAEYEAWSESHRVRSVIVHPRYEFNPELFDFAIWILANKSSIASVTLVSQDQNLTPDGAMATVAGWGATSYRGYASPVLLHADVPIVNKQQCAQAYGFPIVHDSMLCAGYPLGGVDTCQGDSGGPIFIMNDGNPIVVGDSSFGYGCAEPGFPGVYGDAKAALPFVDAVTRGIKYLSMKTVKIVYNEMTRSVMVSTQVIDLGRNVAVAGASVAISLRAELDTGVTVTSHSSGETSSSGVFGFTKPSPGSGAYTACVTTLSAPGYSNVDMFESCAYEYLWG